MNEINQNPKKKDKTAPHVDYDDKQLHRKLLEAIRDGNEAAYGEYYMGFVDPVVRFLTRLTGSEEDAKEITQDVFVMLWEKRRNIEVDKALEGLIYGTAKKMALKVLRRRRIHSRYENEKYHTAEEFDISADDSLIAKETSDTFREVLDRMPPQRRRVFEARRFEGRTYEEIAAEMNITPSTAKTHMKLAVREIKDALSLVLVFLLMG